MPTTSESLAALSPEVKRERLARLLREKTRRAEFVMSAEQERLYLLASLGSDAGAFNVPFAFRLRGTLDPARLRTALEALMARHETLRTGLANDAGKLIQRVAATVATPFSETDLRALDVAQREAELARLASATLCAPFDIGSAPLWRVHWLRLEDTEHALVLSLHHTIADAWSIAVFVREWAALYRGEALPAPEIQYGDFAQWQRGRALEPATLEFWQTQLAQAQPMRLPTDRPRARFDDNAGAHCVMALDTDLIARLNATAQAEGSTLFMILLAAFKSLIARWSGHDDIVIGSPTAGRDRPEVQDLIGFFAYPLALRTRLAGDPDFRAVLARVRETTLGANAHHAIAFAELNRLLGAAAPLRVMFTLADDPAAGLALPGVQAEFLAIDRGLIDFDIFLTVIESAGGAQLVLAYRSALFDAQTMQRFLHGYRDLLAFVALNPEAPLATLPVPSELIAQRERGQMRDRRLCYTVAASFTAEPLEAPLRLWLDELDRAADIAFAPYNQIFQQLLDPHSALAHNDSGANLILLRFEDWSRFEPGIAPDKLRAMLAEFIAAVEQAASRARAPIFICICAASPAATTNALYAELAQSLSDALQDTRGVYVAPPETISTLYPVADYYDAHADTLGHVPYTPAYFAALATFVARQLHALQQTPYKVIALDCDNTLWGGVCGEVGPQGIDCGPAYLAWQRFIVAQQQAGMLVVLCSKNNPEDVEAVFAAHPEFPLQPEHIVARRVNWQSKSANLHALAQELDLGLQSFIFIDDNPLEIAEVEAGCPEVLALPLPADPAALAHFAAHTWAFDRVRVTDVDRMRTEHYRQNREREQLRSALSFDDFLTNLALKIEFAPVTPATLERVAQLTQRTNQFNLTTRRRSATEIAQSGLETLTVSVSDRFGDYGLVGVLMFAADETALSVDSFLLSCRVLGRGVEHAMLAALGQQALARCIATVRLPFRASEKNAPARAFFEAVTGVALDAAERTIYLAAAAAGATVFAPQAQAATDMSRAAGTPAGEADSAPVGASDSAPRGSAARARMARFAALATPDAVLAQLKQQRRSAAPAGLHIAPRTTTESTLAGLWQEVLCLESLGIHDDFFSIGGDSLLATQLLSQIHRSFGVQLGLRDLFEYPTVAQLAERLAQAREPESAIAPIAAGPRPANIPLSFQQERLWFVEQFAPGNPVYNTPAALTLDGPLEIPFLHQALQAVIDRHEALRTRFVETATGPAQHIDAHIPLALPVTDLSAFAPAECALRCDTIILEHSLAPFDFVQGPLWRFHLLRESAERHTLLFNVHHIVSDRWTLVIMVNDLVRAYRALHAGEPLALPAPDVQYADFAVWQRETLTEAAMAREIAYWREKLRDAAPVLELPLDRPRPVLPSYRGAVVHFALPATLAGELKQLAAREGATLFMVLLAAYQTLLLRYTQHEDISVGAPTAGRPMAQLEDVVGFFVNTLVLRSNLGGNPRFTDFLAQVRETTLGAYMHQSLPFEKLLEVLRPNRDLSHSPLFQVCFAWQNTPVPVLEFSGLTCTPRAVDNGTAKFDLTLYMEEAMSGSGEVPGFIEYNSDIFESATVERLLTHFVRLLEGIVAEPTQRLLTLPLLTDAEATRLRAHNHTDAPLPYDQCLQTLFERQAQQTPQAVALIGTDRRFSYAELNARANRLAHDLIARGVQPGMPVAIVMDKCCEQVIAALAILKAGGAYVPIDAHVPAERLAHLLASIDAKLALTLARWAHAGTWPVGVERLCVDADVDADTRDAAANNPPLRQTSEALAYVIFTSGSTGLPKGVMIDHRGAVNTCLDINQRFQIGPDDRVLALSRLNFDLSVYDIFGVLAAGGAIVLPEHSEAPDPDLWAHTVERERVTLWNTVPALFEMFVDHVRHHPDVRRFTALRLVMMSGDWIPPSLPEASRACLPAARLISLGGATEASIWSILYPIEAVDPAWKSIPYGSPMANQHFYVLNAAFEPCPVGVTGDLYIGGIGLALGYWRDEDKTRAAFVVHPLTGERLYKTGDLGRYRLDGHIEFIGRSDFQVKVNGYRIELGEIEAALEAHPAVATAVAAAIGPRQGAKRLVGYVVAADAGADFDADALRAYLRQRLPEYMVPVLILPLERLPLSVNGKVDRAALPVPDTTQIAPTQAYLAPRNDTEHALVKIWSELLEREQIGVRDNFFELGGHSLLAAQVVARVREQFGVELPLRALFEITSIEGAAEYIALLRAPAGAVEDDAEDREEGVI